MIPLSDNKERTSTSFVVWTLVALNVIIYFWDREGRLFAPNIVFSDLVLRPREVVMAITRTGDSFPVVTLFTSMFMHAGVTHLLANMIFLIVFGRTIEEALGSWRFALYYLFWGVAAAAAEIYVDPTSGAAMLGASGAIGGVLGAYFLLYPGNKIEIILPFFPFVRPVVSAWILLGVWFLWQILVPQEGVANWAHAGGFLAGMVTVLILGGRSAILKTEPTFPSDRDYSF